MASSSVDVSRPAGWDTHVHVFDAAQPVRGGHYLPATRSLAQVEAIGAPHGIGRFVLVQPSVYGADNALLLRTLEREPGRHRGVVVLEAEVTDAQLDAMHALGVRGVRFNLVSPVGNGAGALASLAPRLAARGWHVQWYAQSHQLLQLVELQRATALTFVLDHLAGLTPHSPPGDWQAAAELARDGAWIKLSGWYRLEVREPYAELVPLLRRAAESFGERMVWGSDWPHTSLAEPPAYASLLQPVRAAFGDAFTDAVLREFPARLYDRHLASTPPSKKETTC
jgi:predicted TIM-barrel fold metal-dependent hydrolase